MKIKNPIRIKKFLQNSKKTIQLKNMIITNSCINNNIASNIQSTMERNRKNRCQRSVIVGDFGTFY